MLTIVILGCTADHCLACRPEEPDVCLKSACHYGYALQAGQCVRKSETHAINYRYSYIKFNAIGKNAV